MRIGVTYDLKADYLAAGMDPEDAAEFDSEVTIDGICDALVSLGHESDRIGGVKALAARLVAGDRWDAVFNICEGVKGYAREAQVPALLDAYGIPAVFSDALTLALALDKSWCKRIARDHGVPTADFALIETRADVGKVNLPYPLFVKPVAEGSGKGVSKRSFVKNPTELKRAAIDLLARFGEPVLCETFLPGREFTVGITGTGDTAEILGVMEVNIVEQARADAYGFVNKTDWEGRVFYTMPEDDEAAEAGRVALAAWRALRCRDGGRLDVKSDANGRPHFIEVNPLAGINPESSDLVFLARFKGIPYRDLIKRIMDAFVARIAPVAAELVAEPIELRPRTRARARQPTRVAAARAKAPAKRTARVRR
jgi:D-alanine-D-alanine ligase